MAAPTGVTYLAAGSDSEISSSPVDLLGYAIIPDGSNAVNVLFAVGATATTGNRVWGDACSATQGKPYQFNPPLSLNSLTANVSGTNGYAIIHWRPTSNPS
jgi:hypothetical protein